MLINVVDFVRPSFHGFLHDFKSQIFDNWQVVSDKVRMYKFGIHTVQIVFFRMASPKEFIITVS